MTKAEIVQVIYGRLGGFSKKEAADLVDLVFETMKETLARGEKIKISGFGNFVLRDKRQRQGRNPQTGDPIVITERRVLSFKASQILKHGLNPKKGGHADAGGASQNGAGSLGASGASASGATTNGATSRLDARGDAHFDRRSDGHGGTRLDGSRHDSHAVMSASGGATAGRTVSAED